MTNEMEKAVDDSLAAEGYKQTQEPVKLNTRQATVVEQMGQLEKAESHLRERIRRELVEAKIATDRIISEAHAEYERGVSDMVARLQQQRETTILEAKEAYHNKLHQYSELLRRRPSGSPADQ